MKNIFFVVLFMAAVLPFCTKDSTSQKGKGNEVKITTNAITNISSDSASGGGAIQEDGGEPITQRGVCWSTKSDPTDKDTLTLNGKGTGEFFSRIGKLLPNTQYYVRAYAKNKHGIVFGNQVGFKTSAGLPIVSVVNMNSIARTDATARASVTSDGGSGVTQRGVCWSISPSPTIANSRTVDGTGTGSFTSLLTGLSASTTYYVRAYATNSNGTAYGSQTSFSTLAPALPSVTTNSVLSITTNGASAGGSVTSDGGATVTQRGVCWSISPSPTIANNRTINGSGTGPFISSLSGLASGTTYYVRAYATNSVGTTYGNQVIFTTLFVQSPTVSTSTVTSITSNSANGGGTVTADGGAIVTQRGVCWSTTSSSPTINNSRTIDGSGLGSFSSFITGLSSNTTYYLRAYATNSGGTGYGATQMFKTSLVAPTLTSPANGAQVGCCFFYLQWNSVSGATSYEVQLSKSATFAGTIYTLYDCSSAAYPQPSGLNKGFSTSASFCIRGGVSSNNGTWYWRVRALSSSYTSDWSGIRSYNYTY